MTEQVPSDERFGCPQCGGEQNCPCVNCAKDNAGKVLWEWIDGEAIKCGHCGYTAHADHWMDLEGQFYDRLKEVSNG